MGSQIHNLVPGVGPVPCPKMIIGEAPGAEEEKQGAPFVGASGQLLNKALEEIGRTREEFYITNVFKSRPPGNRDPHEEELYAHAHLLRDEFAEVKPSVVLILGKVARNTLLPQFSSQSMADTLAHWLYKEEDEDIKYLCTYHPAYILYNGSNKQLYDAWVDDIRIFAYE